MNYYISFFYKLTLLFWYLFFLVVFVTIGMTVFATESLVYVDRLRLSNNENPRRWGMWLLIPNLVLSFITSICFIISSMLNWCDYRNMQVTGILSHNIEKLNGSVCKFPTDKLIILLKYFDKKNFNFFI